MAGSKQQGKTPTRVNERGDAVKKRNKPPIEKCHETLEGKKACNCKRTKAEKAAKRFRK